jgi:hypothetical protein
MLGSGQLKLADCSLYSLDVMDKTQAVRINSSLQRCLMQEKPQRILRE